MARTKKKTNFYSTKNNNTKKNIDNMIGGTPMSVPNVSWAFSAKTTPAKKAAAAANVNFFMMSLSSWMIGGHTTVTPPPVNL